MNKKLFSFALLGLTFLINTPSVAAGTQMTPVAQEVGTNNQKAEEVPKVFKEGDYYVVLKAQHSEKPEITQYFSTFCGHCRHFENIIAKLKKTLPKSVSFDKKHISWMGGKLGAEMTKAVVTAQELGVDDVIIPALYAQIQDKRAPLYTEKEIRDFFIAHNVPAKDFDNTFNNFLTLSIAQNNDQSFLDLGLTGVPSVVVNNKYLVQPKKNISETEYNQLVNYLLTK